MPSSPFLSLSETDWAAITAVVYGDPTPSQISYVEGLRVTPHGDQLLAELEQDRQAGRGRRGERHSQELAARAETIVRGSARSQSSPPATQRQTSRSTFRTALLSASAAICIGVVAFFSRTPQNSGQVQRYQTATGQRSTVRLADGSAIILAPSTSVSITRSSENVSANVDGEAYFTVVPNAHRPFIVQTQNAVVQVLGTKFSVRQYASEPQSRVVVEDGKILLRPSIARSRRVAPAVLTASMIAQITDSGVVVTRGSTTREYTGWIHGTLVFNRVPLRDVVTELGRAYGASIIVDDTLLAQQPLVLDITIQDQSLARVLDLIGLAMNAHYTVDGRSYVLSPGRKSTKLQQRERFPQPEKQYGR